MSLVLYRKNRPQTFAEIIGQPQITQTLQNEIKLGKIAHAYLFSGPRGLGKTSTARIFAKAINCQTRKGNEPCNQCNSCRSITAGTNLDLVEIDAASTRGINDIRELKEQIKFKPSGGHYKIFIIDEAHMLTKEAFNALLKTLEEPPEYIVFILATTEPYKLPETIISRCQHFNFKKVEQAEIVKLLDKIARKEGIKKIDQQVLELIARQSEGCVRDAQTLLGEVLVLDDKKISLEQAELVIPRSQFNLVADLTKRVIDQDRASSLELINQFVEQGINLVQFSQDWLEFLRKMLLVKVNSNLNKFTLVLDKKVEEVMREINQQTKLEDILRLFELIVQSQQKVKYAILPQIPLELVVLEYIKEDK